MDMKIAFHLIFSYFLSLNKVRRLQFVSLIFVQAIEVTLDLISLLFLFAYLREVASEETGGFERTISLFTGPLSPLGFAIVGGVCVLIVYMSHNLLSLVTEFFGRRLISREQLLTTDRLFRRFRQQPLEVIVTPKTLSLHLLYNRMQELYSKGFAVAHVVISSLLNIIGFALLLVIVDWQMAVASATLLGGVTVALNYVTQARLVAMGHREAEAKSAVQRLISDSVGALPEIRLRGTSDQFEHGVVAATRTHTTIARRAKAIALLPRVINEVMFVAGIVTATIIIVVRGVDYATILPKLVIFGLIGLRLIGIITRLNNNLNSIALSWSHFELWKELRDRFQLHKEDHDIDLPASLNYRSGVVPHPDPANSTLRQALHIHALGFTYPGGAAPAVRGVDLVIPQGQSVGICGVSGSGKTTLLRLMLGLMRPLQGQILCDDWDINRHIDAWHAQIGYVCQNPYLTGSSIRENILLGQDRADQDETRLWHVLEIAQLADRVRALPDGLETRLGGAQGLLSGGERQRLAIARALFANPAVLFLDEATAALDNLTERAFVTAMAQLSGEKTVISVAHRLTTIRQCDCIHLMSEGQIVASGSYEALLESSAAFRNLERVG